MFNTGLLNLLCITWYIVQEENEKLLIIIPHTIKELRDKRTEKNLLTTVNKVSPLTKDNCGKYVYTLTVLWGSQNKQTWLHLSVRFCYWKDACEIKVKRG